MHLEALTAGIGADARAFTGAVHSVFARGCNIELASGTLLGLVARDVGAVPRGFQLATPDRFAFLDHIHAGAPIACRAGLLRIEHSALSIDLRPAIPWRSHLDKYPIACDRPDVAAAWRAAWTALVVHGGAVPLQRQAGDAIATLVRAARTLRPESAPDAIARLIGLGDGLTPAGDDFLVGFLAGLWGLPKSAERRVFRTALTVAIATAVSGTGAISRLYLEAATAGEVSQSLAALAGAIGRGDANETASAVATALAVGDSSGAAASYGLLLAVRAVEPAIRPVAESRPSLSPKRDATRRSGK
ncbi:MAG TPA: DUF2877 domain-containing protein [Stellaceae bacterium]|jgi:hypothetical protein|nr:DUF2877 domain-containing protein [Stellaceae bacterium]